MIGVLGLAVVCHRDDDRSMGGVKWEAAALVAW